MADEIELKLSLPSTGLRQVAAQAWVRSLADAPEVRKTLVSTYYDTKKSSLRDMGISLRVRSVGKMRLQTVKAMECGAPFSRQEWETEIAGDQPDFTRMRETPLEPLGVALKRNLKPIFQTRVSRTTLLLRTRGSLVELAMDQGTVQCADASQQISEVELELKEGDPTALANIAARLSREFPVRYSTRTKPERGYALLEGKYNKPVRSEAIVLKKGTAAAAAFQAIGLSCLRHLTSNEDAVRNRDGEGIHQMRVGLRRLRAAISIFKPILRDRQSEKIKADLRWLTRQLEEARDYDVFLEDSNQSLGKTPTPRGQVSALQAALVKRRGVGFSKARDTVAGERYRKLILRVALWLADGKWQKSENSGQCRYRVRPASEMAREILTKRIKKVSRKIEKLKTLDPVRRHKLRIAIKKLRYAAEFFESLFTRHRSQRKALYKVLAKLQTAMGDLNDIRVHEDLANRIRKGRRTASRREASEAADLLVAEEKRNIRPLLAAVEKRGAHLSRSKLFWK